jgi:hypothetical protein
MKVENCFENMLMYALLRLYRLIRLGVDKSKTL